MVLGASTYYQKATYWANPRQGGFGEMTFDSPVIISVRWEDRVEDFITVEGVEMKSKAIVYTMQDVDIGGYLAFGEVGNADPIITQGALKIQRADEIPDLRGLNVSYRNFL